jgi:hypothetical protein
VNNLIRGLFDVNYQQLIGVYGVVAVSAQTLDHYMTIPKIIHYCWLSGSDKGAVVDRCLDAGRVSCSVAVVLGWQSS